MKIKYFIPIVGLFFISTEKYLKIKKNPKLYAKLLMLESYHSFWFCLFMVLLCIWLIIIKR